MFGYPDGNGCYEDHFGPFHVHSKVKEEPFILRFEPKEDMTAIELSRLLIKEMEYRVLPSELNAFAEKYGSAYRHFRIDEDAEIERDLARKHSDLIGKKITGSLLADLVGRLKGQKGARA